jgi:hypothetical protein
VPPLCDGFAVHKYTNNAWIQVQASLCSGECPPGQVCSNQAPKDILASVKLKTLYSDILSVLENPKEGTYVAIPCRCQ